MKLSDSIRLEINPPTPVAEGVEAWRTRVDFISDSPDQDAIIKSYYVWISGEYLEDVGHMEIGLENAGKLALSVAKQRYEESGNQVPIENGIVCTMKQGMKTVDIVDPKSFVFPTK